MKKLISTLLIVIILIVGLFALTGCTSNNETSGDTSTNNESNDGSNWMTDFNMSNLKVPEGATVEKGVSYSKSDKQIKRDIEFTVEEIDTFAQRVLENCNGAYKTIYNADTDEYEKVTLQNASEAKGDDEFLWTYEENGTTYAIRIYFGTTNNMRFEKYQK